MGAAADAREGSAGRVSGKSIELSDIQVFPARPSVLHRVRRYVQERADAVSLSPEAAGDLIIAVSEAAANSALYSKSPEFEVAWRRHDHRVEVVVEDRGIFRRSLPVADGVEDPGRGRGIQLMMALMDEVDVRHGSEDNPGTRVRLVKYLR